MDKQLSKPTCGVLFRDALQQFTFMDPETIPVFAAGFVTGQAEKVYIGACKAAMFRPSEEYRDMFMRILTDTKERYGLALTSFNGELWIARPENVTLVESIFNLVPNSAEWHELRGQLCGVPPQEIDLKFHLRRGDGERAD
ncbi:MAG: hypothetical protein AAB539_03665 [Patescibacteria group bacterium]